MGLEFTGSSSAILCYHSMRFPPVHLRPRGARPVVFSGSGSGHSSHRGIARPKREVSAREAARRLLEGEAVSGDRGRALGRA